MNHQDEAPQLKLHRGLTIRRIGVIERTYRHAQRYRHIVSVLFKYGFGEFIERLEIENYVEIGLQMVLRDRWEGLEQLSRPERLRRVLEELGPTFIKLGQMLSTHSDFLPAEYMRELERLQDNVSPFPYEEVRSIVEEELGGKLAEFYEEFQPEPLAAASIGQVHAARLTTGEEVVVKVQRPNIVNAVEVDLEILFHLASLMERHLEGWEQHRPTRLVQEFADSISRELDYQNEAANQERFASQFPDNFHLYVPTVFRGQTTSRVLTMQRIHGIKPSEVAVLVENGMDPAEIARRGFDLILEQILTHGFFHADPHPGNLRILPGNVICYLDFGMMGHLSRRMRERFADLVASIATQNEQKAARAFILITEWEEEPDRDRLEMALEGFMRQHFNKALEKLEIGDLLHQLVEMLVSFRMRVPRDFMLVIKALSTVEGFGRKLDPDFDPIRQAAPFLERYQRARMNPRRLLHYASEAGDDILHFLLDLPNDLRQIMRIVKEGRVHIVFQHEGLEPLLHTLNRVSNRLTLALLIGALVVGSSVIVLSGIPPRWGEIPVIGLLGFLLAGFLSLGIVWSILRSDDF